MSNLKTRQLVVFCRYLSISLSDERAFLNCWNADFFARVLRLPPVEVYLLALNSANVGWKWRVWRW